jgi:hypothetical protein
MAKKGPYRKLKYFLGSMIVLAILACIAPFFLKGPADTALVTPDQIKLPELKLPGQKDVDTRSNSPRNRVSDPKNQIAIYHWQDKDGTWHFTDYPNPDGPSQVIYVTPDRPGNKNSSPSLKENREEASEEHDALSGNLAFPITPSNVKKLKEDAETLKKELEKRYEELSELQKPAGGK